MRVIALPSRIALLLLSTLTACSGTDTNSTSLGSGGSEGLGGANGTGGLAATGGSPGAGGNAAGASPATGGNLATGGSTSSTNAATGGLLSTGGKAGTGGMQPVGGSKPTGGASPTGGTNSPGGAQATGGSQTKATGGAQATGGSNAPGGSPSTGGSNATATGGKASTGGSNASATGGKASTGGTTSAAGGAASFKCNNLTAAAGSTGKAKPSGTVGGLKVLNWAGFQGAASFTFDDANSSQVSNYSALEALGVHYTFFLIGNKIASNLSAWKQAVADGHEIGNHTQTHSSVTQSDVQQCDQTIKSDLGVTPYTMANPNGDTTYSQWAQQLYFLDRGVADGLMMPRQVGSGGTDPFNTHCFIPATGAAASAFNSEVDSAVSQGGWRVILVHGFTGGSDGAYQPVDISQFTSAVTYAKGKAGLWIDTYMNVGAYWMGQNAFPSSATTTANWTLPAHFPPNMCLRVTTTGGTVTQGGTEVPWDDHGYYQISLDAGSVTVQ